MTSTFTIFFAGTGSNSWDASYNDNYWNGELISTLAANHTGSEFVDWTIIDGPGSGNLQEDEKWVKPGNYPKWWGTMTGAGWEQNVAHACAMIKGVFTWERRKLTEDEYKQLTDAGVPLSDPRRSGWFWRALEYPERRITPQELQAKKVEIMRKGKLPDVVNAVGWSRGAVSCHMLANAMARDPDLHHIPVNIFAVDPVPGTGQFQAHRTTVPANVHNYVAVYARDERSVGFAPTVPSFQCRNAPVILPMRGRHATVVGNAAVDGADGEQNLRAPGIIVRNLAELYLGAWGTQLGKTLQLSNVRMAELYAEVVRDAEHYEAMHSRAYIAGQTEQKDGQRLVGKGSDWRSTRFEDIQGPELAQPQGLRQQGQYLSWHHAQVAS